MKTVFAAIGVALLLFLGGFCIWTEAKHDMPIWEYVQDKFDNEKQAEDVTAENEDGTVEATAKIEF